MTHDLIINEDVKYILQQLNNAGYDAYIVGGAVRDLILGRDPKDFDISTSATPAEIKSVFGRSARIIGRRFRLVHLTKNRVCYEISTFRREPTEAERVSRQDDDGVMIWRDNQYGTIEQDARRRDFTVNSLYYSPLVTPRFRDFCDGRRDLDTGTVRAIGDPDRRLAEDPVRVIRALKLVGEYHFTLADNLTAPLRARAAMVEKCSQTRLFEEVLKILQKPYATPTFTAMRRHGALRSVLPSLDKLWEKPAGKLTRRILAERDKRLAESRHYSNSRVQALSCLIYPRVCAELSVPDGELWAYYPGIEHDIRDTILAFLSPLPIPRALSTRLRDVFLLLPRFRETKGRQRLLSHPDYRYARELFSILTTLFTWDQDTLEHWPVLGTGHPHRGQPQGRRRPSRSRPRRRPR
ncbi:MAG: hypothetical protein RRC34_02265 [Lentisphaeria bacterium]|nr:hypothetical protein [Lentisphaeria bacterium]